MISSSYSFQIINVAIREAKSEGCVPDPNIFLWIATSVADADAIYPDGIKRFLANGISTFLIKSNPVFSNGLKSLHKNLLDCPNLCSSLCDNFMFAEEPFAKALQSSKV